MFGDFEWDPEHLPNLKLGLHVGQILFGFVAWCLEIAVFQNDTAEIVGNNGWMFAVCLLSVPAWIYNIMTPRWERTRRLAEPHAMLTVDVLFTIFWLSAFSAQAAYNTANKCGNVCGISKAIVALGVFVTIAWGVTVVLSMYTLQYYNNNGTLPGYDKQRIRNTNIDPDKAAFSMAPHDEEAYAPVNMDDRDPGRGDEYASGAYAGGAAYTGGRTDTYDDDDPHRYGALPSRQNQAFETETEYNAHASTPQPYVAPTAQDAYDEDRPAQFPAGNYDRVR